MVRIDEKIGYIAKALGLTKSGLCEIPGLSEDVMVRVNNGELESEVIIEKVDRLFGIAAKITNSVITLTPYTLQRRQFHGRTFFGLLKSSQSSVDAINKIIHTLLKESAQHNKIQASLSNICQTPVPVATYDKPNLCDYQD